MLGQNIFFEREHHEISLREKPLNDLLDKLNITRADFTESFCDNSKCSPYKNLKSRYFDDDHLSVYGAESLSDEIKKMLLEKGYQPVLKDWMHV